MMHNITARIYSSEAEMYEAYRARQNRLRKPETRKEEVVLALAPPEPTATQRLPMWSWDDLRFDAHVRDFRDWQMSKGFPLKRYIAMRSEELGFTFDEMIGKSRHRPLVAARQLIMWEIKTAIRPSISYPEIGRIFGGRDHTTALHAVKKIEIEMASWRAARA